MEAFLTTLPPYVHEFIDKYPPTDVFNLLKELICFAVLYSEDRDKLNQSTTDFLKKKQGSAHHADKDECTKQENDDATVPEEKAIASIAEETETETELASLKTKPTYNIRTGELIDADKPIMPNTFPEWWGHDESAPKKAESKETIKHEEADDNKTLPQSFGASWISWENQQPSSAPSTINHRKERARSQIIPNLRSYPAEDAKPTSTSPSSAAAMKKRYTLNTATASPTAIKTTAKPQRRISSPALCGSPEPASKIIETVAKQQNKTTSGTSAPTRSASVILKPPRQNAAMRARAEHARIQQEEQEKKKNAPAHGSSNSLRLKQRVNSGIDWETIKRDRRKPVDEVAVPNKD